MSLKFLLLLLGLIGLASSLGFGMGGGGGCCCGGCGGCGGGGGCCGGGAFGRKKRSTDDFESHLETSSKDPACNNEHLRELMKENIASTIVQSEDKISKALETESSSFAVLCSNDTIGFKASPQMVHCTFIGPNHQCVAFSL